MNFSIEISKLVITIFCFSISIMNNLDQINLNESYWYYFSFKKSLFFSIPGLLYFITNNLSLFIQSYMDSASYQILCNLKIFSTTILFYLVMPVKVSKVKFLSIFLIFSAGIIYIYGNIVTSLGRGTIKELFITKLGNFFSF